MLTRDVIRKVRRIEIRTRHAVQDVFAGRYHSVFKGQGIEFQEVREYVPGDDIRTIDWNVTARYGAPYIKKFSEERELTVILLVDVSASLAYGSGPQLKRDLVAEIAALLAFSAIANQDRVGVIFFTNRIEKYIPPAKGPTHVLRLISEILSFLPAAKGTNLAPALSLLNQVQRRRTVTFLLTDFLVPPCGNLLRVTARRHDLVALWISDKQEVALPSAGFVNFRDPETGRRVLIDTSYAPTRRAWAAQQIAWRENLLHELRRAGIDCVELTASTPFTQQLIQFFRSREKRR